MSKRDDWLAKRREIITGTDVPIILGVSKWSTPLKLWAQKLGYEQEQEQTDAMRLGIRLQPVVLQEYADRTGREVIPEPEYEIRMHPDIPFLGASIDALTVNDDGAQIPLEAKTTSLPEEWENGTPAAYLVQVAVQISVMKAPAGAIAALLFGRGRPGFATRDIPASDFLSRILPKLEEFYDCLRNRREPQAEAPEDKAVLQRLYPQSEPGTLIELPGVVEDWWRDAEALSEVVRGHEEQIGTLKARIAQMMGSFESGRTPGGLVLTYKTQKRAEHVVKESSFRVLRAKKEK